MLCIHGRLYVVARHAASGHRARVGIRQGNLSVRRLDHPLADPLQLAHLPLDGLDLLLYVFDALFRHQCRFPVRSSNSVIYRAMLSSNCCIRALSLRSVKFCRDY
jgi:hypothetical protein